MAKIRPFRALRPEPSLASTIAAVPYDVVNTEEAHALAAGNDLSFLHVSRAEIDLPPDTNPYADIVYRTAKGRGRVADERPFGVHTSACSNGRLARHRREGEKAG
jgi:uncharacterized protein (DUF1015 family)